MQIFLIFVIFFVGCSSVQERTVKYWPKKTVQSTERTVKYLPKKTVQSPERSDDSMAKTNKYLPEKIETRNTVWCIDRFEEVNKVSIDVIVLCTKFSQFLRYYGRFSELMRHKPEMTEKKCEEKASKLKIDLKKLKLQVLNFYKGFRNLDFRNGIKFPVDKKVKEKIEREGTSLFLGLFLMLNTKINNLLNTIEIDQLSMSLYCVDTPNFFMDSKGPAVLKRR